MFIGRSPLAVKELYKPKVRNIYFILVITHNLIDNDRGVSVDVTFLSIYEKPEE